MASLIEAVIYDGGGTPGAVPPGARTVSLGGGLTLLPVTGDLAAQLDQSEAGDERICRAWMLRQPVAALTRRISAGRRALYACGQTFAGPGIQEAIGWRDGVLLFGPSGTCDLEADLEPGHHLASRGDSAISAGLRVLGVIAAPGMDEFETAGLARHRFTSDWLTSPLPGRTSDAQRDLFDGCLA